MRKLIAITTSLLLLSFASAAMSATTERHVASTPVARHEASPAVHAPPTAASARYKRIRAKAHRNAALARSQARALRLAEETR